MSDLSASFIIVGFMTIAVVLEFEGGSLEQYDEVVRLMGFEPGGRGAPGGLFHWVTATETGIRVTDVWSDRETFDTFARDQIGPLTAQAGITAPPKVSVYEVHNYLTAG
jgi:hypothetical protein